MASESLGAVPKVIVHLRATGEALKLKQDKFKDSTRVLGDNMQHYCIIEISGADKFAKVIDFLRRQLHRETMFVYVNSSFSPNPDELIIDLYKNFGINGTLVVNYAYSVAWG